MSFILASVIATAISIASMFLLYFYYATEWVWVAALFIMISNMCDIFVNRKAKGEVYKKEFGLWLLNLGDRIKEYAVYAIIGAAQARIGQAPFIPFLAFLVIAYRDYDNHLIARWNGISYGNMLSYNGETIRNPMLYMIVRPTPRYMAVSLGLAADLFEYVMPAIIAIYLTIDIVIDYRIWKRGVPEFML